MYLSASGRLSFHRSTAQSESKMKVKVCCQSAAISTESETRLHQESPRFLPPFKIVTKQEQKQEQQSYEDLAVGVPLFRAQLPLQHSWSCGAEDLELARP